MGVASISAVRAFRKMFAPTRGSSRNIGILMCAIIAACIASLAAESDMQITVNNTTELQFFDKAANYAEAKDACQEIGGGLAPFAISPDEMKQWACDHSETWILDDSVGDNKVSLDQSAFGSAESPARATSTCDGYCKGCGLEPEEKPYACCVGEGCTSFPDSSSGATIVILKMTSGLVVAALICSCQRTRLLSSKVNG